MHLVQYWMQQKPVSRSLAPSEFGSVLIVKFISSAAQQCNVILTYINWVRFSLDSIAAEQAIAEQRNKL